MENTDNNYKNILIDVLEAAKAKDYAGYSKFDALNSRFLKMLALGNKWMRLIITQAIMRSSINFRPLLGVKKSRNPKGIAQFARAYLFLYRETGEEEYLHEAKRLLRWLVENPSVNQKNLCWGYNFIWQNTIFLQDLFEPNVIVTIFVGEALIHAYRVTGNREYLECANSVGRFILNDVPILYDNGDERAIAYVLRNVDAIVLNNNVLAGAFLIKLWKETRNDELRVVAEKLLNYTYRKRTDYYAWFYTYPEGKSPIKHDNYHTGGILDGFIEYFEETDDDRYMDAYWSGLEYYMTYLFEPDGAPRWMNDSRYPHDIHGSAQGIVSFTKAGKHRAGYFEQAEKIADWTLKNLYREKTEDFAYRKGRFHKWNYSLMRWCNAWMARAFGELINAGK